jgi:hypothetical protein
LSPNLDTAKVEYAIETSMAYYSQEDPRPALNLYVFILARRGLETPPALFFPYHRRFHTDLEVAGRKGKPEFVDAMRQVGQTLINESAVAAI